MPFCKETDKKSSKGMQAAAFTRTLKKPPKDYAINT